MSDLPPLIHMPIEEWKNWAEYFAKLFPTATPLWIEEMTRRIMKTLCFAGTERTLTPREYLTRLMDLKGRVDCIPPDPGNLLTNGGNE